MFAFKSVFVLLENFVHLLFSIIQVWSAPQWVVGEGGEGSHSQSKSGYRQGIFSYL